MRQTFTGLRCTYEVYSGLSHPILLITEVSSFSIESKDTELRTLLAVSTHHVQRALSDALVS